MIEPDFDSFAVRHGKGEAQLLFTRLVADMEFASVDIIQLMVAIEEHYNRPKMGFQDLLMNDGSYVDDLSIGQVIDFVHAKLTGVPA